MLTVMPRLSDEEKALLAVAHRVDLIQPHHALLCVLTSFYVVGAVTLVFAPDNQLFTQGTQPVFALLSPLAWAAWFIAASLATASVLARLTRARQVLAWFIVLPSQTVWIGAGLIAVFVQGDGSAFGVVFPATVLAYTLVTVWATRRAYTSGKR